MKKQKINFHYNGKKISLEVCRVPWYLGWLGLMFKSKKTKALVFDFFKKDVRIKFHSFFVFFDFYILWLDGNNRVLEYRRIKPFDPWIMPSIKFRKVVEIPVNCNYDEILKILDEERKV